MRVLSISRREALGLLTMLWDWAGDYAPDGAIGRFSNAEIVAALEFPDDMSEKIVSALIETGFLDKVSKKTGRLVIHDWNDHCEQWVRKRLVRRRVTYDDASGQCPDTGRTVDRPPEPEPEAAARSLSPKPSPKPAAGLPPPDAPGSSAGSLGKFPLGFSGSGSGSTAGSAPPGAPENPPPPSPSPGLNGNGRAHGRVHFKAECIRLLKLSLGERQREADMTVLEGWWDDIWPESATEDEGAERLRQWLDLAGKSHRKQRPMAWLTERMKQVDATT